MTVPRPCPCHDSAPALPMQVDAASAVEEREHLMHNLSGPHQYDTTSGRTLRQLLSPGPLNIGPAGCGGMDSSPAWSMIAAREALVSQSHTHQQQQQQQQQHPPGRSPLNIKHSSMRSVSPLQHVWSPGASLYSTKGAQFADIDYSQVSSALVAAINSQVQLSSAARLEVVCAGRCCCMCRRPLLMHAKRCSDGCSVAARAIDAAAGCDDAGGGGGPHCGVQPG